jgi:hypothetical protein
MGVSALVKKVLAEVGINPDRFNLQWASAAEAPRFVKLITEFTEQAKKLGPIGESEGLSKEELKDRINTALNLVSSRKLRVSFGNTTKTIRKEAEPSQEFINGVVDEKLSKTISSVLVEAGLLAGLANGPVSLTALVKAMGAKKADVEKLLETLTKQGKVELKAKKWALVAD